MKKRTLQKVVHHANKMRKKKSGNMAKMKCVENINELTKNSRLCKFQSLRAVLLTIQGRKI